MKDITLNSMNNVHILVRFNYGFPTESGVMNYYPIFIEYRGEATSDGVGYIHAAESRNVGSPRETPYTPTEFFTILKSINVTLANDLKELYLNAINEDIGD